ncbi:MAG: CoA-binding protein [Elusimicrobiota bacterium]
MKDIKEKIIAVVGVSGNPKKFGYKIFKSLLDADYDVSGINPAGGEVLGKKIFRKLEEVSHKPELVITVVPPQITEKIIEQCMELGIKEIWMQPGSESEDAIKKAKEYGMSVTHHACIMVSQGI